MELNGKNGRWQLAFWLITVICGIWLLALTNGVVGNERIRVEKDEKIMCIVYTQLNAINARLTRIETKLETN